MLLGILRCNLAWGIIDGVMYVMTVLMNRGHKARLLRSLQDETDERRALASVGRALDDRLAPLTSAEEREHLYRQIVRRLKGLGPETTRVNRDDVFGAGACFVLVFVSAIPAIVPFLLVRDRFVALRLSNVLLLTMLFLVGYRWAREAQANAWLFASSLTAVGLALVGIAMSLGG